MHSSEASRSGRYAFESSIAMICVGTSMMCVMRSRSIAAIAASASNCRRTMYVPPRYSVGIMVTYAPLNMSAPVCRVRDSGVIRNAVAISRQYIERT